MGAGHNGRYTTHYAKIRDGRSKGFELYVFTYIAGFLALQLTAFRWASITKKPRWLPTLTQDAGFDKTSVSLWPGDGRPTVWPPHKHFDDESIEIFANRWDRLRERL